MSAADAALDRLDDLLLEHPRIALLDSLILRCEDRDQLQRLRMERRRIVSALRRKRRAGR